MKKCTLMISIFLISVILCIIMPVPMNISRAQDMFPRGKWWKHSEVLKNLDISDEQIQKIEGVFNESMRKIIQLEADLKIARLDLEDLLDQVDQAKLDLKALESQIELVNKTRGELEKERILMLARIRNVLPKETIKQLRKLRGQFGMGKRDKMSRMDKEECPDEFHRQEDE